MKTKTLKDLQYVINKEFRNIEDKSFKVEGHHAVGLSNLVEGVFGDKLTIYTDDSETVITDNWNSFKVEYNLYGDMPESISMSVKKQTNTNSDTNVIVKFIKEFVRPKKY